MNYLRPFPHCGVAIRQLDGIVSDCTRVIIRIAIPVINNDARIANRRQFNEESLVNVLTVFLDGKIVEPGDGVAVIHVRRQAVNT